MFRWSSVTAIVIAAGIFGGCTGGPSRIAPPSIDPAGAANAALVEYDSNSDGLLSKDELEACPALLSAITDYDTNGDQAISSNELAARFQSWIDSRVGITNAAFYLHLDGRPLPRAMVTLDPEPFLSDALKPANGTTDSAGRVGLTLPPEELPDGVRFGLRSGLYKIRVQHPAIKHPEKYDEQTILGIEVPPQSNVVSPPTIEMTN